MTTRVDAARTGHVPGDGLVPPLRQLWSRVFKSPVNQPIVAGGMVFFTVSQAFNGAPVSLLALDASTGRTRWRVGALSGTTRLAYDRGVLVGTGDDRSRAYRAATGAVMWSGPALEGDPVITGGAVYGHELALDAATGQSIWSRGNPGSESAPAVTADRVYIAAVCGIAYALDRATGKDIWTKRGDCASGGGGGSATLAGRRLITQDYSFTSGVTFLNSANGRTFGARATNARPVVTGDLIVTNATSDSRQILTGADIGTGRVKWRRATARNTAADNSAPFNLVGAGRWIFRHHAEIEAISAATGIRVTAFRPPFFSPFGDDIPQRNLAAGPGVLVSTGGRRISGFTSKFTPSGSALSALPEFGAYVFGDRIKVLGRAGPGLAGRKVRVSGQSATVQGDGFFLVRVPAQRNAKLRAVSGSSRSRAYQIFVYPASSFRVRRTGFNRVRTTVTVRGPRGLRLTGRRVVLYQVRPARRFASRIATARLRSSGRGRASAAFDFAALRSVSDSDYFDICIPGQARLGLGPPADPLLRRCGRARIKF